MTNAKPFTISMEVVREAFRRIRSNGGTYGIDRVSLEDFEKNCEGNLYKIWNRMSSGTYMPPAVRRVEIPKKGAGTRPLGIPTVGDRVAQMVVKLYLEPACEEKFHANSYGYRPKRSAHMAVEQARERCFEYSWVIDLDIKSFFDTIDHELLMKAVKRHTTEPWILLYINRWIEAPVQTESGEIQARKVGTPQGSVISPLLSNLFLHYVFDAWMDKCIPYCPFERYADDIIVHSRSLMQANYVLSELKKRFEQCKLTLHPDKTKIVYCKFGKSKRVGGKHPNKSFDFLGFTFKPRSQKDVIKRVAAYWAFIPGMSIRSRTAVMDKVRQWNLKRRIGLTLDDIARWVNPIIRGWVQYYGAFWRPAMSQLFYNIDFHIVKWFKAKYRVKSNVKAWAWLNNVRKRQSDLFAHWKPRTAMAGQ